MNGARNWMRLDMLLRAVLLPPRDLGGDRGTARRATRLGVAVSDSR